METDNTTKEFNADSLPCKTQNCEYFDENNMQCICPEGEKKPCEDTFKSEGLSLGTLYDMNKNIISQLKPLSKTKITEGLNKIKEFLKLNSSSIYFMLLCHERRDYTIFNIAHEDCEDEVMNDFYECFFNREATFYSINPADTAQAMEIWVKIPDENGEENMYCYYFFQCDDFVLTY